MKVFEREVSRPEVSRIIKGATAAAGLALFMTGCGAGGTSHATAESPTPTIAPRSVLDACTPFTVIAQNRWDPLGTAVRDQPDVSLPNKGGFAGNLPISVDGYYDTGVPLDAHNPAPFNSGIWFHLTPGADTNKGQEGFVSYRGVRDETTEPDPDPRDNPPGDGGKPVPLRPECRIVALPTSAQ
ncbi:MAG: hypothetical protein JWM81_980 [Candidatus Saccharibacteria bacterium]|nr:hypothetical protein [Candidatus Saccharibacteria bacterium]